MITSLRRAAPGHEIHSLGTVVLIGMLTLTGCEPLQVPELHRTPMQAEVEARSLSDEGRHQAAAEAYLQLAQQADTIERQHFLILVADERRMAGTPEVAQSILDRLSYPVDATNLLLWSQVSAEIEIVLGNPQRALDNLDRAPPTSDAEAVSNILRIRSNALFRLGRPVEATQALLTREVWLTNRAAIIDNQRLLWEGFQIWGGNLAADASPDEDDPILQGWLDLGLIAWSHRTNTTAMRRGLTDWETANPSHPANRVLIPEILSGLQNIEEMPRQVALLLPLSGRQRLSANAVRDGFIAAHFASAGSPESFDRPVIRLYDVNNPNLAEAYRQAIEDGANFVVGPLLKESVESLALAGIATPTLALNFILDTTPTADAFYQFSLSPEDEARQVAQRAAALGQFRALALAPNNTWGRRLLDSFTDEMQNRGGQILHYELYDPMSPDFSSSIEALLLINESQARRDRLSANLGIQFEYEARRRTDIDLIFLAANANAGKLIRPQLRFHYAGSVPTYSTSAIYQEGSRNNSDINGIMFPDIPWIIAPDGQSVAIRHALAEYWPNQAQRLSRLYALGFDAYRLMPLLNAGMGPTELEGVTGVLHLDDQGRILRRLPWARIQGGKPELMNPAPLQSDNSGIMLLAE